MNRRPPTISPLPFPDEFRLSIHETKTVDKATAALALWAVTVGLGCLLLVTSSVFALVPALLFALVLPGFLTTLAIIRTFQVTAQTLILSVGLSIVLVMGAIASLNVVGLALGFTAPMDKFSIIMVLLVLNGGLLLLRGRWAETTITYRLPTFSRLDTMVMGLAASMVVVESIGALRLNNGADGWVSAMGFMAIAGLMAYVIIVAQRVGRLALMSSLFLIGAAIFLSGWLRSWYVAGPDVSLEYNIASFVRDSGLWSITSYRNAYNSCLSVAVLIPTISFLSNVDVLTIFKVIVPLLYCLTIPVVYLIAERFIPKKYALLSTLFFVAQPVFTVWWWIPARQEIAFLLFAIFILTLIWLDIKHRHRYILMILLGAGVVVAHYSTAVLMVGLLLVLIGISFVCRRFFGKTSRNLRLISPAISLALLIAYFGWYAQLTYGFSGISSFLTKSANSIGLIFNDSAQAGGQGLWSQFNVFARPGEATISTKEYVDKTIKKATTGYGVRNVHPADGAQTIRRREYDDSKKREAGYATVRNLAIVISKLIAVVGALGLLYVMLFRRAKDSDTVFVLPVASLLVVGLTIVIPFFSVGYDQVRTYQQMLIVLMAGGGAVYMLSGVYRKIAYGLCAVFIPVFFVLSSHVLLFFTGSNNVPANFSNTGQDVALRYVTSQDIYAAQWLRASKDSKVPVAGDGWSRYRMRLTLSAQESDRYIRWVIPGAIPKSSYIYITSGNTATSMAFDNTETNAVFTYSYPFEYLNGIKNTVYSNGKSRVMR